MLEIILHFICKSETCNINDARHTNETRVKGEKKSSKQGKTITKLMKFFSPQKCYY